MCGYQQLQAIGKALDQLQETECESNYLRLLNQRVKRVLENNCKVAEDLRVAHHFLSQIAQCLHYPPDPKVAPSRLNTPLIVEEMEKLLEQFQPIGKIRQAQINLLSAARKRWRSYGQELLHCYDIPGLPQDNLRLESLFGGLRPAQRRISGRKSTRELHDFGQAQVLFKAESEADLLFQIRRVPHTEYLKHRQRLAELESPRQFFRRLHHDPVKTMQALVDQHLARQEALAISKAPVINKQGLHII
jgi:hypothetical protein